ncbi:hypothetical protein N7509_006432 [Penicillium cosmopolitanum]|uniref:GmrSD restriction endonucleases C-terminal domain-containing protein n=1 Tax=Penicillium cosmopolitanum TaxID=1131564 RepID=A0A9W9W437_9EURO|nr:uncharacterized protein N7509_006432 [Penicillium cosmopolitanum]KAJ5398319.1 hypothetical protein N7509_006432 [Penicillium cosmopolitanum]
MVMASITVKALVALALIQSPLVVGIPTAPGIPSASTAKTELGDLTVAAQGSQDGYSRAKFPHWISQGEVSCETLLLRIWIILTSLSSGCDTRDVVLKRDGTGVVQDDSCSASSGKWVSPYDGATWTAASDLDIDHVVPLSNAWKSGASEWTTDDRQAFANDLTHPQLLAVTDNVNSAKGDKGPEEWKPPLASYYCTYAEMWVKVKSTYNLTVTTDEKSALVDMLDTC